MRFPIYNWRRIASARCSLVLVCAITAWFGHTDLPDYQGVGPATNRCSPLTAESRGLKMSSMLNIHPKTFGARLRLKRTLHGMTQRELGAEAVIGFTHICQIETGKVPEWRINLGTVCALARALRCKPGWLAGWK